MTASAHSVEPETIGFIGLGVMGEPMCRNLAEKCGRPVHAFDTRLGALARLREYGVEASESVAALASACSTIFMALPSGIEVEAVCTEDGGLLETVRPGTLVVDLGTSPVDLTRDIAARFASRSARYADAPIARTRQAAEDGSLSIMVGADASTFGELRPLLACMATDVTHCGPVGSGQIVKILNNMVLIETVVALSEALVLARKAGLDGSVLFETLTKGSADSFALRNHGLRAMVPEAFPQRAFSTDYARKDLGYALRLAREAGVSVRGAVLADDLLQKAQDAGFGDLYWPVVSRIVASGG